jgi:hypothetical protein
MINSQPKNGQLFNTRLKVGEGITFQRGSKFLKYPGQDGYRSQGLQG